VTSTDEILALAAAAADAMSVAASGAAPFLPAGPAGPAGPSADARAVAVTDAVLAAFADAATRGAGSAPVQALLAVRPAAGGDNPAWTAWLAAAAAAADVAWVAGEQAAGASRPVWYAVFGAALALAGPPGSTYSGAAVTVAAIAGLRAAAIVEAGLADWDGWSSGTVAAAIGAGVTAGLLVDLAGPRLRAAIGICATQAAGLRAAEGTDAFAVQVGKAAFNGVEAALLARAGFTAPAEPLDGRRGLFALFG
jgi:2-methylcitrate dehydratase PrpD